MTKRKQITLYLILFLLFICTIISITYAYYSFVAESNTTITAKVDMPNCTSLSYTSGTKITISGDNAVPISDGKALSGTAYRYSFTVTNNCSRATNALIVLSTESSSTMPIGALKYAIKLVTEPLPTSGLYLPTATSLSSQVQEEILSQTGETVTSGYSLASISLAANETKNYYLYLWIDENEGGLGNNATTNKSLLAHLSIMNLSGRASEMLTVIASLSKTATNVSGNPADMVEDHGIRYVGSNPNNWVWFNCSNLANQNATNCERWRIIGVFNEKYDTNNDGIPDTEGDLIKITSNMPLGVLHWDAKYGSINSPVGSSIDGDFSTNYIGSNDWSDSQLMMLLNPPEFLNSGYVTEGGTAVHNYTIDSNGYVLDDHATPIKIFKNMGSYFDSSMTAYRPYFVYAPYGYGKDSSGNDLIESESNVLLGTAYYQKRMSNTSQSLIATVKWYLTGPNGANYTDSSNGLASHFYNYERNINNSGYVYTGAGTRPKIWYGKVGLIYPSDYGFSTSGDSSISGYDRESCLNIPLKFWLNWGQYVDNYANCAANSWLLYLGSSGNELGEPSNQWTITPGSSRSTGVFTYGGSYGVDMGDPVSQTRARQTLFLEADTKIVSGNGSYDSPYVLAQ